MADDVQHLLGRIDGKLDQVIKAVDRHIDDDVRRFGEVYGRLDEQSADINKAKGAKGAVLWLIGGGAGAIGAAAAFAVKAFGG
jgi:hypothetical protein